MTETICEFYLSLQKSHNNNIDFPLYANLSKQSFDFLASAKPEEYLNDLPEDILPENSINTINNPQVK